MEQPGEGHEQGGVPKGVFVLVGLGLMLFLVRWLFVPGDTALDRQLGLASLAIMWVVVIWSIVNSRRQLNK